MDDIKVQHRSKVSSMERSSSRDCREAVLKDAGEVQQLLITLVQCVFTDDGDQSSEFAQPCIGTYIWSDTDLWSSRVVSAPIQDPISRESDGRTLDRWIDTLLMQFTTDNNLPFRNVPREVRNGVGNVITGHGQNWELGNGTLLPLHDTSTLVEQPRSVYMYPGYPRRPGTSSRPHRFDEVRRNSLSCPCR